MLGFALGSLSSGILSWRMAFYMTGLIGFLWCIVWTFMVTSDPAEHRLVSDSELDYIQQEIRRLNKGRKQSAGSSRKAPAPWLRIHTNPVVLAFMAAKFTVKLSTDAQTTQLPMYLEQVFHVSKGTVSKSLKELCMMSTHLSIRTDNNKTNQFQFKTSAPQNRTLPLLRPTLLSNASSLALLLGQLKSVLLEGLGV